LLTLSKIECSVTVMPFAYAYANIDRLGLHFRVMSD